MFVFLMKKTYLKSNLSLFLIFYAIIFVPLIVLADIPDNSPAANNILTPDTWFNALKKNITIPLLASDKTIIQSTPEEALQSISPQLKEINQNIKDSVGIDFAKFVAWIARALTVFFQIIINTLQSVSNALK